MDLVFKVITDPAPAVPLVGDTNFQQHYSGVNTSMAWQELEPAIRQATEKFVLDYVGTELYDDLAGAFQNGDTLEDYQGKALQLLQDAVAYYAIYHILPEKNSVVTSMGVVTNSPDGGSQPVNQWGWKAKRWSALENGDIFLDRLLAYLEQQVAAAVTYFDLWKDSSAYTLKTSDFFRHTAELDEHLNIQRARRSFISLVRFMRQVETDIIKPLLCDDLYAAVLEASPTDENALLLPYIRRAVAYLGAAEAIPHHRVVVDGDGFRVVSQIDQFDDRRNLTNNTHEGAIQALLLRCEEQGRRAVARLAKFLEDNVDDYPDYRDSACREKPASKAHSIVQSSSETGTVGLF